MMRWATFWFAVASGAATFSVVAIARAAGGHPEFVVGYVYLFFAGFGVGWAVFLGLDAWDLYLDHAASRNKQNADTELTLARAEAARIALERTQTPLPDSPATDQGNNESLVYSQRWRVMAHRFLTAGDRYGFAIRVMVGRELVTWDGWIAMTGVLCDAGVLVKSPRAGWASGWDYARWEAESRTLPLPCPMTDPPTVGISPTNNGNNAHNSAPEVVEGLRAD